MPTSIGSQFVPAVSSTNGYVKQVLPGHGSMLWLTQGVLHVERGSGEISVDEPGQETVFVCLAGTATIEVNKERFAFTKHDALYLPKDMQAIVASEDRATFCTASAPVEGKYPLQYVPYSEVCKNEKLSFVSGAPGTQREINLLVAHNVLAGRLIVGATRSLPGNWTSWPPHEHATTLEESYFYYDMPEPAFGLQMLYEQTVETSNVAVVREGDAVLLPAGYHPNVAVPGHQLNFIWIMAAHRESLDRQWGVVNNDPAFAG
jgi:5-deoxy-glucuronate isomerase